MPVERTESRRTMPGSSRFDTGPADPLAAKRARLGTALHELANELANERRRNAQLERENRRLREQLTLNGLKTA